MIISFLNQIDAVDDVSEQRWIGHQLNQAAARIRTMTAAALAPLGITPPQLRALEAISREQPLSQVRLGELVNMDRSTIVHIVDRFEALGAASREADPADRRSHAVILTPQGARLLAEARDRARDVEDHVLSPLSHDERAALAALLTRLFDPTPCPEEKAREPRPAPPHAE